MKSFYRVLFVFVFLVHRNTAFATSLLKRANWLTTHENTFDVMIRYHHLLGDCHSEQALITIKPTMRSYFFSNPDKIDETMNNNPNPRGLALNEAISFDRKEMYKYTVKLCGSLTENRSFTYNDVQNANNFLLTLKNSEPEIYKAINGSRNQFIW